jgi:hypothetical protein
MDYTSNLTKKRYWLYEKIGNSIYTGQNIHKLPEKAQRDKNGNGKD